MKNPEAKDRQKIDLYVYFPYEDKDYCMISLSCPQAHPDLVRNPTFNDYCEQLMMILKLEHWFIYSVYI